jgi:predicted DNA-binding transcriptional regulator AlpA
MGVIMNQKPQKLTAQQLANADLLVGIETPKKQATFTLEQTRNLLNVIAYGTGEELLTKSDLRAVGAHPFSDSTRRRKIKNREYPQPIMLSPQMSLWCCSSIREWLKDPTNYKQNSLKKSILKKGA